MSQYGEMIDSGVDLERINTYELFTKYFQNPTLTLIKTIQAEMFVVYGCKIKSMLAKDNRYLLLTISSQKLSHPFPSQISMENLEWQCLETRLLPDELSVTTHTYTLKTINSPILVFSKDDQKFLYSCNEYPLITITLFSTKYQTRPYNDKGSLSLALETYQCAVNL